MTFGKQINIGFTSTFQLVWRKTCWTTSKHQSCISKRKRITCHTIDSIRYQIMPWILILFLSNSPLVIYSSPFVTSSVITGFPSALAQLIRSFFWLLLSLFHCWLVTIVLLFYRRRGRTVGTSISKGLLGRFRQEFGRRFFSLSTEGIGGIKYLSATFSWPTQGKISAGTRSRSSGCCENRRINQGRREINKYMCGKSLLVRFFIHNLQSWSSSLIWLVDILRQSVIYLPLQRRRSPMESSINRWIRVHWIKNRLYEPFVCNWMDKECGRGQDTANEGFAVQ